MFLLFTAWAVIQVVLLLVSIAFLVLGIKNIFDYTGISLVLIVISIFTISQIYDSLITIFRAIFL